MRLYQGDTVSNLHDKKQQPSVVELTEGGGEGGRVVVVVVGGGGGQCIYILYDSMYRLLLLTAFI